MSNNSARTKFILALVGIVVALCLVVFGVIGFPSLSGSEETAEETVTAETETKSNATTEQTEEAESSVIETGTEKVEDDTTTDGTVETSTDNADSAGSSSDTDSEHESAAYVGMTDEEIAELEALIADAEAANYDSTPVSYVYNDEGDTITVGVEGTTDGNGIYLVPTSSAATPLTKIGFYILRSNYLDYGDTIGSGSVSALSNYDNVVIVNQTYDNLWASTYTENSYPVRWTDVDRYTGSITESDTVYMRAVDLISHELLATFRVEIRYDSSSNTYYIADIYDSDVVSTGDLTEQDREDLVTAAVAFLENGTAITINGTDEESDIIHEEDAFVECVPKTYFRQMYSTSVTAISSDEYIRDGNIYAVSIPVDGLGFVTVYYVPEEQIVYGFTDSATMDLVLYGFDAITPFTVDSILTENEFVPNA